MKQYKRVIDGRTEYFREPLVVGGRQVFNASEEQMKAAGWEEYSPEEETAEAVEYVPSYEERVVELIRERYSVDDEIAILRQKDNKIEEYREWYLYCEKCKKNVKNG